MKIWPLFWMPLLLTIFYLKPALGISEQSYLESFSLEVLPFYRELLKGQIQGKDRAIDAFRLFKSPQERGAIVLLPGRGMSIMNYAETLYDLRSLNLSIYVFQHRGQGESSRLTQKLEMQYVESFDHYISDLKLFIDQIVLPQNYGHLFLVADSMGAAIGTRFLQENPGIFEKLVLIAPMFGLGTTLGGEKLLYHTALALCKTGWGPYYAPSQGDFKPVLASESYLSRSEIRYGMANYILTSYPDLKIGGISNQWFVAAVEGIEKIRVSQTAVSIPTLLITAENDTVVNNGVASSLCQTWPRCTQIDLKDSYHGIVMERDEIRDQFLNEMMNFLRVDNAF